MKRLLLTLLFLPTLAYSADADKPNDRSFRPITEIVTQAERHAEEIWTEIEASGMTVREYFEIKYLKDPEEKIKTEEKKFFSLSSGKKLRHKEEPFPSFITPEDIPKDMIEESCLLPDEKKLLTILQKKADEYKERLNIAYPIKVYIREETLDCSCLRQPHNLVFISIKSLKRGLHYALGILLHEISHFTGDIDYLKATRRARTCLTKYRGLGGNRIRSFSRTSVFDEHRADSRAALLGPEEAAAVKGTLIKNYRPQSAQKTKTPTHPEYPDRIHAASVIVYLLGKESASPSEASSGIASPLASLSENPSRISSPNISLDEGLSSESEC